MSTSRCGARSVSRKLPAHAYFSSRVLGPAVRDATLLRPLVDSICAENLIRRAVDKLDMQLVTCVPRLAPVRGRGQPLIIFVLSVDRYLAYGVDKAAAAG